MAIRASGDVIHVCLLHKNEYLLGSTGGKVYFAHNINLVHKQFVVYVCVHCACITRTLVHFEVVFGLQRVYHTLLLYLFLTHTLG